MKSKLYIFIIGTSILSSNMAYGDLSCPNMQQWTGREVNFPEGWSLLWAKNHQPETLVFQGAWIFDVKSGKPAECHYAYKSNPAETAVRLKNPQIFSAPEGISFHFSKPVEIVPDGSHCKGQNVNDCRFAPIQPSEVKPNEVPKKTTPPAVVPTQPAPLPVQPITPVPPAMAPTPSAPVPIQPVTPVPPPMEPIKPAE